MGATKVTSTKRFPVSTSPGFKSMSTVIVPLSTDTPVLLSSIATFVTADVVRIEASGSVRYGPAGTASATLVTMHSLATGDLLEYRYNGIDLSFMANSASLTAVILSIIKEN